MRHLIFALVTLPFAAIAACDGKVTLGDLPDGSQVLPDGSDDRTPDTNPAPATCAADAAPPSCIRGGVCSCDDTSPYIAPICVNDAWACPAGSTRFEDCRGIPPEPSCRDAGLTDVDLPDVVCPISATSSLDGVSIAFTGTTCAFTLAQAAAGISIPYRIVVAHDITGTHAARQHTGNCTPPGTEGLLPFESLGGNGQSYSLHDQGLPCFDAGINPPNTVTHGTYDATFTWDGRNYSGPSDTGNPEGAPFPAGDYTLSVDARGTVPGDGGIDQPYDVNMQMHVVLF